VLARGPQYNSQTRNSEIEGITTHQQDHPVMSGQERHPIAQTLGHGIDHTGTGQLGLVVAADLIRPGGRSHGRSDRREQQIPGVNRRLGARVRRARDQGRR
jgi:hypothetical protein